MPFSFINANIIKGLVDMLVEQLMDLTSAAYGIIYETDEEQKKKRIEKIAKEQLPNNIELLEKFLQKQNTGFLVGSELTLADLALVVTLERVVDYGLDELLEKSPLVKALNEKVRAHPRIADWIAKRPASDW